MNIETTYFHCQYEVSTQKTLL